MQVDGCPNTLTSLRREPVFTAPNSLHQLSPHFYSLLCFSLFPKACREQQAILHERYRALYPTNINITLQKSSFLLKRLERLT